VLKHIKYWNQ